jgi:hypothetical protein
MPQKATGIQTLRGYYDENPHHHQGVGTQSQSHRSTAMQLDEGYVLWPVA